MIVTERLRRSGYEVEYVSDGNQAIDRVDANAYDLMIFDIHMPGRMGYAVCEYAKKSAKNANAPVILISAFPEEQTKWRQSYADAYLAKPFETGRLNAEVERLLKKTT